MKNCRFILLCLLFVVQPLLGQDTSKIHFTVKSYLIPAGLMTAGLVAAPFRKEIHSHLTSGKEVTSLDDYIQYFPLISMYAGNCFGAKSKHDAFTKTKLLAFSYAISSATVYFLKTTTSIERPNGKGTHSFPSGHTTFAFTGATALWFEYKKSNRALAYSGFAFAAITGILRVVNNEHWVSDVLFGAGIGIATTTMVYQWHPLKNWNPWKKGQANITFAPIVSPNMAGGVLEIQL